MRESGVCCGGTLVWYERDWTLRMSHALRGWLRGVGITLIIVGVQENFDNDNVTVDDPEGSPSDSSFDGDGGINIHTWSVVRFLEHTLVSAASMTSTIHDGPMLLHNLHMLCKAR